MDTTGKLPGGMVTVAVCAILLMAIVVPVTQSMASTLDGSSVANEVPSSADKAVYSEAVSIYFMESTSSGTAYRFVQIDGGTSFPITGDFLVFSDHVALNFHADGVHFVSGSGSGNLGYPVSLTLDSSGLTVSDGQTLTYPDAGWVIFSWLDRTGYPEATHGLSSLPAYLGTGQAMVHYALSSGSLSEYAFYEGGSQAHRLGGGTYDMTTEQVKSGVVRVTAASNGGASVTSWLVPLEVSPGAGNAIIHTLIVILPVLLAAALIVGLAAWMMPSEGRSRDSVYSIR